MVDSSPAGLEAWMPRYQESQRLELWKLVGSPANWLTAQGWLETCYLLMSWMRVSAGSILVVHLSCGCKLVGGMPVFSHARRSERSADIGGAKTLKKVQSKTIQAQ